jgi:hypothetical protein
MKDKGKREIVVRDGGRGKEGKEGKEGKLL